MMLELVNNTATAISLIVAVCLPLLTLIDLEETKSSKRMIQVQQPSSILELPLITEGYPTKDLKKIESMNFELNGLLTIYSVPKPTLGLR